jgi:hypothetical protein
MMDNDPLSGTPLQARAALAKASTPSTGRSVVIVTTSLLTIYDYDARIDDSWILKNANTVFSLVPGMHHSRLGDESDLRKFPKSHGDPEG